MKSDQPQYEFPVLDIAWSQGIGQPAGVFLLDGHCHVASYTSPAAHHLLKAGALLVATLRFDAGQEAFHPERWIRPLAPHEAVRQFGGVAPRSSADVRYQR